MLVSATPYKHEDHIFSNARFQLSHPNMKTTLFGNARFCYTFQAWRPHFLQCSFSAKPSKHEDHTFLQCSFLLHYPNMKTTFFAMLVFC
jgi:hypothetical protein